MILRYTLLVHSIGRIGAGPCDPGTVVYAPYPDLGVMVQATVVSQVIEGSFIVQWTGSPDLCINPTNRQKCVVDATESYNGRVCSYILRPRIRMIEPVLCEQADYTCTIHVHYNSGSGFVD